MILAPLGPLRCCPPLRPDARLVDVTGYGAGSNGTLLVVLAQGLAIQLAELD